MKSKFSSSDNQTRLFEISKALRDWFRSQKITYEDGIFAMNTLITIVVVDHSETLEDALVKLDALHERMTAHVRARFDVIKKGADRGYH
jgi:hypothetical protein